MPATIVQTDNLQATTNNPIVQTFFESFYGMPNVQAGNAIVAFLGGQVYTTTVTSITDNYGNTWEQVPGAYIGDSNSGAWQDVWWAQNINPVTDPPTALKLTIELNGTPSSSSCSVVLVECSGINGTTPVAGHTAVGGSPDPAALNGPSMNGGSGTLYLASLCSIFAASGDADNSSHASVSSPWALPAQSGPGTGGSGFPWSGNNGPCVAGLVSSGTQQPVFNTQLVDDGSTPFDFGVISAVAFTNPLAITTTSLPNAVIGQPYSQALQATGGTTPYTWSKISGSLPPGLSLASDGVISGTPTEGGNFFFTVSVTDSESPAVTVQQSLALDCVAGGPQAGGWQAYQQVVQQRPQPLRPFYKPRK